MTVNIKNTIIKMVLPVILGILTFSVTFFSGKHGLYFFDSAISYHYGWLILNGRIPYVDIINPLGPLCGYLTALGYQLFGVSYLSGVLLASLLAGFGAGLISIWLRRIMPSLDAAILTILLSLPGLPLFGTLYYNNLVIYFAALFLVSVFLRLFYRDSLEYSVPMWTFVGLLGLTKVHVGVLFLFFGIAVELIIFIRNRFSGKPIDTLLSIVYKSLPIVIAGIFFIWSANWNVTKIIESLLMPTPRLYCLLTSGLEYCLLSFVALAIVAFFCDLQYRQNKFKKYYELMSIIVVFIFVMLLVSLTTPDRMSIYYFSFGIALLAIYEYFTLSFKNKHYGKNVVLLISIFVIVCQGMSIYRGDRKNWDEYSSSFIKNLNVSEVKYSYGFFKDINIRKAQFDGIMIVDEIVSAFPNKKIFFGPELEMFYPATKRLPPKQWILWSHPGTSFSMKKIGSQLKSTLVYEGYDIVFFDVKREPLFPYMDLKSLGFKYVSGVSKNSWIFCAVKDKKDAIKIQSLYNKIYPIPLIEGH